MSFLEATDQPGQVVRNVLRGEFGSAARQGVDFLGNVVDAVLPGDWIPKFTRDEDYVTTADLIGMDEDAHWAKRLGVNLAGDTITNPLTFLTGGTGAAAQVGKGLAKAGARGASRAAIKKGGVDAAEASLEAQRAALPQYLERTLSGAARKDPSASMARHLPGATKALEDGGVEGVQRYLRGLDDFDQGGVRFFGKQILSPEARITKAIGPALQFPGQILGPAMQKLRIATGNPSLDAAAESTLQQARAAGDLSSQVHESFVRGLIKDKGLTPGSQETELVSAVFDGVLKQGDEWVPLQGQNIGQRIFELEQLHPGANWQQVKQTVQSVDDWNREMWKEWAEEGVVTEGMGGNTEYLARIFSGKIKEGDIDRSLSGVLQSAKGRSLKTPEELATFLNENPDVTMELDSAVRMLGRAQQQGKAISRAQTIRSFMDDKIVMNAKSTKQQVDNYIRALRGAGEEDFATVFETATKGMPPREGIMKLLATGNRFFKRAAVFGVGIPRVAGIMKNRLGGLWQAFSTKGVSATKNAEQMVPDVLDAFFGKGGGEIATGLKAVDQAIGSAKGSVKEAKAFLANSNAKYAKEMAEAIDHGVFDNYVTTEQLGNDIKTWHDAWRRQGGSKEKWVNFLDWPANVFQKVESRMRVGTFIDLRKRGFSPEQAAKMTRDSYLDYSIMSPANRTLRDIIPFAAFTMKTIPQQAGLIARQPGVAVAASQVYGQESPEGQVPYPYLEEQARIPLGKTGPTGDPLFLAGLGLPLETLNILPGASTAGQDIRRGIVASSQPLAKMAYSAVTGKDPFFGSDAFQYSKAPQFLQALGAPEYGDVGQAYRIAEQTGLIQPLAALSQTIDKISDPRLDPASRAVSAISGARVVAVDQDKARLQQIDRALEASDEVGYISMPYLKGENDALSDLLKERRLLRRELKRKRSRAEATIGE